MLAKDLIEILKKLPEDTIICETEGETGCTDLGSAKYFPQYDILYLEPFWPRNGTGYIDMADCNSICDDRAYRTIRDLAARGKAIVDKMSDGKMHRIQVVQTFSVCEDMCNDFAVKVDGEYRGGRQGEGVKQVMCDFEWESLSPQVGDVVRG